MKIAYVHDVIYPYVKGGAEKRVWEIARRLADGGHEVHIFCMKLWDGEDVIERGGSTSMASASRGGCTSMGNDL